MTDAVIKIQYERNIFSMVSIVYIIVYHLLSIIHIYSFSLNRGRVYTEHCITDFLA